MDSIQDIFSQNLQRFRGSRTQAEMANAAGTTMNYISLLESGKRFPRPDMIAGLAKAYGVEEWQLFVPTKEDQMKTVAAQIKSATKNFSETIDTISRLTETEAPKGVPKKLLPLQKIVKMNPTSDEIIELEVFLESVRNSRRRNAEKQSKSQKKSS